MSPSPALAARLRALRELRPAGPSGPLARLREVVVVASSSRGGSSVFTELLRHSPHLLHLQAEVNPFLALAGLTHPASGTGSDALLADTPGDRGLLEQELARELGRWDHALHDDEAFAADLAWRLTTQWPEVAIDPDRVRAWVGAALAAQAWSPGAPVHTTALHLDVLAAARAEGLPLHPGFYDLDPDRLAERFPALETPEGPPGGLVIEEPPFVAIRPWRRADAEDLERLPLVIKTPSNAYRLDFWRALFPNARLRVLHLVRAPAASINGLYDGWRYHGFHSHRLEAPLAIAGYVDHRPADARWWKYDLPPGWTAWTDRPLEQVAGFQWASAHRATLDWLSRAPEDRLQVRFEDVVGPPERRAATFARLCGWLGVPFDGALAEAAMRGIPPVMATTRPRQRRWFEKAHLLEPVLRAEPVRGVTEALGYEVMDG